MWTILASCIFLCIQPGLSSLSNLTELPNITESRPADTMNFTQANDSLSNLPMNRGIWLPIIGEINLPDPICKLSVPEAWGPSVINPQLSIYTKSQTTKFRISDYSQIKDRVAQLDQAGYFAPDRQVVFVTHGYLNSDYFDWLYDIKDAFLKMSEESTVIIVGWGYGSFVPSYPQAGSNTQTVSSVIAQTAQAILNSATFKGDAEKLYLYCIGHSLGAHICGQAGRKSGQFDRITGLDPAGPGFHTCWPENGLLGLSKDTAKCVDNIHTDGEGKGHFNALVPHYGTLKSWGHADFYPNGGFDQVGCHFWNNDAGPYACSHVKSIAFYTYSLNTGPSACSSNGNCTDTKKLPGTCASGTGVLTQPMGYYSSCHKSAKAIVEGNFYIKTKKREPYC